MVRDHFRKRLTGTPGTEIELEDDRFIKHCTGVDGPALSNSFLFVIEDPSTSSLLVPPSTKPNEETLLGRRLWRKHEKNLLLY